MCHWTLLLASHQLPPRHYHRSAAQQLVIHLITLLQLCIVTSHNVKFIQIVLFSSYILIIDNTRWLCYIYVYITSRIYSRTVWRLLETFSQSFAIHSESKKLFHYTFVHNFDKCWSIFTIFLLLYSKKFATKPIPHCPPHLRCVAALPCEMLNEICKICKILLHLTLT